MWGRSDSEGDNDNDRHRRYQEGCREMPRIADSQSYSKQGRHSATKQTYISDNISGDKDKKVRMKIIGVDITVRRRT